MQANSAITIGGVEVKPDTRKTVNLPIADLYTGTELSMPVKVIVGSKSGPVMFVSAAIHGDELNGVEITRRLLKRKTLSALRGTLIVVPVVNVHGFLNRSRYLPDRRDLNRCFPGSRKGSIAARLANTFLTEVVRKSDFGIDLHTGALNRSNLPQIRANLDHEKTLQLARAFAAPVIISSNLREGSLRQCAASLNKPILVYEAGEALRFDEISIRGGVRGIINIMRSVDMLPALKRKSVKEVHAVEARSTSWVRASESGVVSMKLPLGTRVTEGQQLAIISSPLGDEEEPVLAPFAGIIIGRSNLPLAHEGDALFNIAEFKSASKAEALVDDFTATHETG